MPVYNLTGLAANTTGPLTFTQNVNSVLMFGWLGTLFLMGVAVVLFMGFMWSTQSVRRSVSATGIITFILSLLLAAMELMPDWTVFITLALAAVSVAFAYKNQ